MVSRTEVIPGVYWMVQDGKAFFSKNAGLCPPGPGGFAPRRWKTRAGAERFIEKLKAKGLTIPGSPPKAVCNADEVM